MHEAGKLTGSPDFSVKSPPLFPLPVKPEVPIIHSLCEDLLHMRMRMSDNLTAKAIDKSGDYCEDRLAVSFQGVARKTGVPFSIYEHNVHGKNQIAFSSLTGRNWRVFLSKIGGQIRASTGVFNDVDKERIAWLYEELDSILNFAGKCQRTDAEEVFNRANAWMSVYVSMNFKPTPYTHLFHLHLWKSVELYGPQDRFSGELVELANDSMKQTHHRRTDKRNPKLTLQTQLRIEMQVRNGELDQQARARLRKRKAGPLHPWQGEGVRNYLQEKRLREEREREAVTLQEKGCYDRMSIEQLKSLIHQRTGKKTRKKNKDALKAILINADQMELSADSAAGRCLVIGHHSEASLFLPFYTMINHDLFLIWDQVWRKALIRRCKNLKRMTMIALRSRKKQNQNLSSCLKCIIRCNRCYEL